MKTTITIAGVELTPAAAANVEECGPGASIVGSDIAAMRSGEQTREGLLMHCLDGAEDDRVQGWRDYVEAVVAAAAVDPGRAAYLDKFHDRSAAMRYEQTVLGVGREFLPPCATAVLDGNDPTPEYWAWLTEQVVQASRESAEVSS